MPNFKLKAQSGFATPLAIILLFVITIVGIAALNISTGSYQMAQSENLGSHAQLAAEAGLDYGVQSIFNDSSWTPPSGETVVMDEGGIRTTYKLTLSSGLNPGEKILRSEGRTYRPSTVSDPKASRIYEVALVESTGMGGGAASLLTYAVISGPGGLSMSNSANINGSVYSLGGITMTNSSSINTGSGGQVLAANSSCGAPAVYPAECSSGQPINISSSAGISGTVYATNQYSTSGMSNPGLQAGDATIMAFPAPPDRNPVKAATSSNPVMSGTSASCSGGNATWPANTKINGDVVIKSGCDLVILGDMWITGSLKISHSSSITFSNSLTQKPIIMIDGPAGLIMTGSTGIIPNSSGLGGRFITYHSTASCSPECTNITGQDLINSMPIITINIGNSVNDSAGSEFFAAWTTAKSTNSASFGAIAGQRVILGNSSSIINGQSVTFSSTIPPSGGSGGGSGSIIANSYRRVY